MTLTNAWANDPPTKPIKPASASSKEEASASAKEESKSSKETKEGKESKESKSAKSSKDAKAEEAARLKEAAAADELAAKIAEKLAVIRKEKETRPRVVGAPPLVRPYSLAPRTAERTAKAKKNEAGHEAAHWSYEGETGPMQWGKMNSANAKCDLGERQSPIDIRDGIKVDLDTINFDYKPVSFSVVDNGHTIQVNLGAGNYISVSGKTYELLQFHFHRPSEERINGRGFEMVAHLVHKDREGKLAVVAVLLEAGQNQEVIQLVWNNLPLEKNDPVKALSNIDVSKLLPAKRDYYTYMGSLTTPPCSEGVLWLVLKQTVEVSADQIGIFSRLYPMNARPIQKSAGRIIKESR
ncbi:carbonic anhydrase family protein [Undibacterium cyanobacteriorum]|uniref:carbonic anhydrase n=1 Tax=Undibacterium cyanobacteriorum TaxID=3073561 RepID=A0ABY9RKA3_9BURK|nr:carbonic anhydrase family protein [Undibacterium sp. 20NA77.5]WMW80471.1 carbonic anhydrase family protein [Undibacterium sp. 20NA77.5]